MLVLEGTVERDPLTGDLQVFESEVATPTTHNLAQLFQAYEGRAVRITVAPVEVLQEAMQMLEESGGPGVTSAVMIGDLQETRRVR